MNTNDNDWMDLSGLKEILAPCEIEIGRLASLIYQTEGPYLFEGDNAFYTLRNIIAEMTHVSQESAWL